MAENVMQRSCLNCHSSGKEELPYLFSSKENFIKEKPKSSQCLKCHASLIVLAKSGEQPSWSIPFTEEVLKRFNDNQSFGHIPQLSDFKKYTDCGLRQFLRSPVSRRFNGRESMFPLQEKVIDEVMQGRRLEECRHLSFSPEMINNGRVLFIKLSCVSCHSEGGEGPKLRIGIPLLSYSYFEANLKRNSHHLNKGWLREAYRTNVISKKLNGGIQMPAFSLTEVEKKSLYAYLSSSKEDLVKHMLQTNEVKQESYGKALYGSVVKNVFTKSCQHCHSNSSEMEQDNQRIFGENNIRSSSFTLPTLNRKAIKSNRLKEVLSPGTKCQDSLIVKVLLERHNEWRGEKKSALRGMPLTGAPLSLNAINQLRDWTNQGCPTGEEFLCQPCEKN